MCVLRQSSMRQRLDNARAPELEVATLDANDELDAGAERHHAPLINGSNGHAQPMTEVQHAHPNRCFRMLQYTLADYSHMVIASDMCPAAAHWHVVCEPLIEELPCRLQKTRMLLLDQHCRQRRMS